MIKAVIFDFDGTIADTIPAIREGVNRTMRLYGYPEHADADILRFINNGARELIRRAMPEALRGDEELVSRVLGDYNQCYGDVCSLTRFPYDGIGELVVRLHGAYRIGVLSNKQDVYVKLLCEQVLPKGSYDVAQGVVDGKPTKPHPYLSELVAASLGVRPEECAMVGDSDVDIITAANAGMRHIGVSWGYRDESFLCSKGATRIAHTPEEIEVFLK